MKKGSAGGGKQIVNHCETAQEPEATGTEEAQTIITRHLGRAEVKVRSRPNLGEGKERPFDKDIRTGGTRFWAMRMENGLETPEENATQDGRHRFARQNTT